MKSMYKIYHLDQLPFSQFKQLGENLSDPRIPVRITEKVDGTNCSIGVRERAVYVKTKKGSFVFDPEQFQHLFNKYNEPVFLGFKKLLQHCKQHETTLAQIFNYFGIEQVFFELVPNRQPNIVSYNFNSENGVLYLFDEVFEEKEFFDNFVQIFSPDWNCIKASINLDRADTENLISFLSVDNDDFMHCYSQWMSSRKRDEHTLQKKAEGKEVYQKCLDRSKKDFLDKIKDCPSVIGGGEIEGCIVRVGDISFKVVDLDNFGERREEKWESKDRLQQIRKECKKRIISEVFGNGDILTNKSKQKECVIHYNSVAGSILNDLFEEKRVRFDTLPKIINDTVEIILKENISDQFLPQYVEFLDDLYSMKYATFGDLRLAVEFVLGPSRIEELEKVISN